VDTWVDEHTHTHTHTCVFLCMYLWMYARIYVYIYIYIYTYTYTMCECFYVCTYAFTHVCMYSYVCVYACMYVCMYLKWNNKVLLSNVNFPANTVLSADEITQITPGPTNSRQRQGQNRNSTGHLVPQYAPIYSLVLNIEKRKDVKCLPSLILQDFSGVVCNTHSEKGSTISNIEIWAGHTIKLCEPHVWQPSLQRH